MLKKLGLYGAALIGVYLVVDNASGSKGILSSFFSGAGGLVKNLQGRG